MSVAAAVVSGPGRLSIESFPDPRLGPGEALVRMELSGICGTDKHVFKGEGTLYAGTMMEAQAVFPVIPGHENVGVIEELGPGAAEGLEYYGRPLAAGDRVVMCPDVVCGRCWWCRHHSMVWCENITCYGVTLGCEQPPHLFGGWAEHLVLRSDAFVYKVPDGLAPELAVLVEPLVVTGVLSEAVGFSLTGGEGFRGGDTVVVQGVGALGLMFVLRARTMGAGTIVAVDAAPARLRLAERLGVTHTLDLTATSAEERVEHVRALTDGRGADVVIDCAGVPEAVPEGLEMARKGGTYIEPGAFVEMGTVPISPHRHLCSKSIRLIGVTNHPHTGYGPALALLERYGDVFPFRELITHRFPLQEAGRALETSSGLEAGKVLIGGNGATR
ncbi:MAG TPA: zinc-binding dehydrogenase [Solirubrobacteraceae bacterium]|nr:zinc-binding dehydrogenase [Solirubrobacteraceae bacterium]